MCVLLSYLYYVCIVVLLCVYCTCSMCVLLSYLFCVFIVVIVLCVYCCRTCPMCVLQYLLNYVCVAGVTLDAELQARSQYSEGSATGQLDTGFSWFPCLKAYAKMVPKTPSCYCMLLM